MEERARSRWESRWTCSGPRSTTEIVERKRNFGGCMGSKGPPEKGKNNGRGVYGTKGLKRRN